jgi:hypothetical protein
MPNVESGPGRWQENIAVAQRHAEVGEFLMGHYCKNLLSLNVS